MIRFTYKSNDESLRVMVEIPEDSTIREAVEAFESFLRACSYSFDGSLEIIEDPVSDGEKEA